MDGEIRAQIDSEDYADLIIFYLNNPERLSQYVDAVIHYMNETFAIVHVPVNQIKERVISTLGYTVIPKLYGVTSSVSLEATGVPKLRAIPSFNLRGSGVLIGIVDTGIDYTNPVFIKPDGSTKIISLWDQTLASKTAPAVTGFGTEYNWEQINMALNSKNPYEIVPSIDEIGHGTMLASVAVGNEVPKEQFAGVAPESDLIIVKVRQAKNYLRDFLVIPKDVPCYQENHIMWGVEYCAKVARNLNRPIVIMTGLGTSQGPHKGSGALAQLMSIIGDSPDTITVTPIGNEGNLNRHFHGEIEGNLGVSTVELYVGENEQGFSMELWGDSIGVYSLDILSPSGEFIPRSRLSKDISFIFSQTKISIDFQLSQTPTGEPLILIRFRNVSSGIWKFNIYSEINLSSNFDIWLPMGNFISTNTYFTKADNYVTLLCPGSATVPIAVTAYDITNNSLYTYASRGYTRNDIIKPELAAPGVNYIATNQNQEFVAYTGSSVAAAHTAGIVAMILEWAVIRGNEPEVDTIEIKNYLIRGAKRFPGLTYPNREWGYGAINIFSVFDILR